jgi:putative transposase
MPRKPRMYLPNIPCHVIQRGNNRSACFFTEADYRFYLNCVKDAAGKFQVAVHAYVLMTNHVHLLMTPVDRSGISKVMQSIVRRYVQYVNKTYKRSGTLWEDRHKASLVQAEDYLLVCHRYIEMNPVRAGMVNHPGDYPWSSYRHNAYCEPDGLVHYNPVYLQLGKDNEQRCYQYRDLFAVDLC